MTDQAPEQLATIPTVDAGVTPPLGPGDLDVVRIYNEDLDAYGESPRAGVKNLAGWEVVEPTVEEAAAITEFDPSGHNVSEVLEQLEGATEGEREAILALERDGKARTTILNWTPPDEDD